MPTLNTTASSNQITITTTGTYEINYNMIGTASLAVGITMAIRRNGTNIASATSNRLLSVGVQSIYSGSVIVNLTAGDVIDMAVSALLAATLTLSNETNATLSVKRIS